MDSADFEASRGEKQLQEERRPVTRTSAGKLDEADEAMPYSPTDGNSLKPVYDYTHRRLKSRHIQLIGIGGYVIFHRASACGQLNV